MSVRQVCLGLAATALLALGSGCSNHSNCCRPAPSAYQPCPSCGDGGAPVVPAPTQSFAAPGGPGCCGR
jgi:hypothetical protein